MLVYVSFRSRLNHISDEKSYSIQFMANKNSQWNSLYVLKAYLRHAIKR